MPRLVVLQHVDRESPGLFAKIAEERGMSVLVYRLDKEQPLPRLSNSDLLLILGGPMSVKDIDNLNFPWLSKEINLIKDALKKEISIIGICLGAQLLAYAAGGDVEPLLEESSSQPLPEIGWGKIFFRDGWENKLKNSLIKTPFNVLHWHGDRILLPPSAELIASSNYCKEQFFRIGTCAFGLQFHVEIDDQMIKRWINEDSKFIKSALGIKAKLILSKQQKEYGSKTFHSRLSFLRQLFEIIGF